MSRNMERTNQITTSELWSEDSSSCHRALSTRDGDCGESGCRWKQTFLSQGWDQGWKLTWVRDCSNFLTLANSWRLISIRLEHTWPRSTELTVITKIPVLKIENMPFLVWGEILVVTFSTICHMFAIGVQDSSEIGKVLLCQTQTLQLLRLAPQGPALPPNAPHRLPPARRQVLDYLRLGLLRSFRYGDLQLLGDYLLRLQRLKGTWSAHH